MPLTASRFARWLPSGRRGRIILAAVCGVLAITGVFGAIFLPEIKLCYALWRNSMPKETWLRLRDARTITVYSLYPDRVDPLTRNSGGDPSWIAGMTNDDLLSLPQFNDYPVLGVFDLADANVIRAVADELSDGTKRYSAAFQCYIPRHGIRVEDDYGILDLVVCYTCNRFERIENGKLIQHHYLSLAGAPQGQELFNIEFSKREIRVSATSPVRTKATK